MKTLIYIFQIIFCAVALFGSLFFLPKTSTFLTEKFPKAKDMTMKTIVISMVLYGTASLATSLAN